MYGWKISFVLGWPVFKGKLLVLRSVISTASLLVEFFQSISLEWNSTSKKTEKATSVGENGFHSDERHHVQLLTA